MDTAAAVLIGLALLSLALAVIALIRLVASQSRMLMARTPVEAARADAIARAKPITESSPNPLPDPASRV